LRRRVVFAVIFLAAFILLFRFVLLAGEFDTVVTAARFESARDNFTALRAFLYRIPKGGDLHTHLAGAVYAERFIAWAAQEDLCVDLENRVLAKLQCGRAGARPMSDAMSDQKLYAAWWMRSRCAISYPARPCRADTTDSSPHSTGSERYPARISST